MHATSGLSRRNFVTHLIVGLVSLPFVRWAKRAQVKGKLGDAKGVDHAAMLMAKESHMSDPDFGYAGDSGKHSATYRAGSFRRIPLAPH
jgi:hypothetical protein